MTDRNFFHLCPDLQSLAQTFLSQVNAELVKKLPPSTCKIVVTWRDAAEQGAAYDKGLSNARAGQSPHNCTLPDGTPASKAFDFAILESSGAYVTNGTDSRYTAAGKIAEELGLVWGGRFSHPDFDHIELANWKTSEILA